MPDFVVDTFQIFPKAGVTFVMSPSQVADLGCVNTMATLRINVRGRLTRTKAAESCVASMRSRFSQTYQEGCKASGLDSGNMIVVG